MPCSGHSMAPLHAIVFLLPRGKHSCSGYDSIAYSIMKLASKLAWSQLPCPSSVFVPNQHVYNSTCTPYLLFRKPGNSRNKTRYEEENYTPQLISPLPNSMTRSKPNPHALAPTLAPTQAHPPAARRRRLLPSPPHWHHYYTPSLARAPGLIAAVIHTYPSGLT